MAEVSPPSHHSQFEKSLRRRNRAPPAGAVARENRRSGGSFLAASSGTKCSLREAESAQQNTVAELFPEILMVAEHSHR